VRSLRGADGFFLYKESRTQHLHTIKVQVIEPAAGDVISIDEVKRGLEPGIARIPPFHWQLVKMPIRIVHPIWRYRARLDLDYHVRRAAVPSPGGKREFAEVISEIASTGLERDRPLWQVWVVEGLAGGRIAYVTKLHHAVADGISSARILLDGFAERPDLENEAALHVWSGGDEPEPSTRVLLRHELRMLRRFVAMLPNFLRRGARFLWIGLRRRLRGEPRGAQPFSAPSMRFNQPITPHRWYAYAQVSVSDMKRIKDELGGTLNDVFVALCSGAVRRYLDAHGELPEEPLTASVPVSIRKAHEERTYGNRTSSWIVSLATDIADPLARYHAIVASTQGARAAHDAKDPELLGDAMELWPIYRFVLNAFNTLGRKLTGRPSISTIVSNVRGPSEPIYSGGSKVVDLLSMGPIVDDQGLNFTGWSYLDKMNIGIVACREHVPDIWDMAEGAESELEILLGVLKASSAQQPDLDRSAS
jgi:WS/DGAT/MGAT family acyltransferase